jgi:glycosyltransferase involved in cell wall biosynthesis
MHLLYLIDELSSRAGTEKHLLSLSEGMARLGHRVSVLSLMDGPFAENLRVRQSEGIFYRCLNVRRIYDLNGLAAVKALAGFICREKIDVIQSFHTGSDLIAPVAAKLAQTKVVAVSSRRDIGFTKSRRHVAVQRFLNRGVRAIIANSRAVKQSVIDQENFPADRIEIICNGIDLKPFRKEYEKPAFLQPIFDRSKTPFIVGNAGNLKKMKGHAFLIEAAARLCKKHDNAFFAIAGDGPLKGSLIEKCSDLGIADRVHFLGNIAEVPAFLKWLDVYVQPSESEGFSNSIIEAMATGCPVVATNVGGNPDAISDSEAGFLVTFNDVDRLTNRVETLIKDKELRIRIGENGRRRAQSLFSLESMIESYDSFYRQIRLLDGLGNPANPV